MLIIQFAAFGIIATIISIVLRRSNPEYAIILSLITGILIFYLVLPELKNIFNNLINISDNFDIHISYVAILLKIIGIAYISEFASQLCNDAGESSIASKIEFAGKILIMIVSLPVMNELIELITNMFSISS
jgi:stage III sporulation protein AD